MLSVVHLLVNQIRLKYFMYVHLCKEYTIIYIIIQMLD
jgi:hypothetical protein